MNITHWYIPIVSDKSKTVIDSCIVYRLDIGREFPASDQEIR